MRAIVLLAALCSATPARADSSFQFELKIGSYSVGFRVVQLSDQSRSRTAQRDCRAGEADGQVRIAAIAAPAVAADKGRQSAAR